ncbi:MAG TPA: RHS repeat-associated core domain-containing protein [Sedimentisphaerales bacterium]|nr:RHS repeat-associated core domain-containing protein [Sedimentisphaerales bacterium]HRS12722.1 RHS repeat-associated core domain-containing protein [Sedimentisphaerales bacterium]HRV49362.1 RHS repeat-associated core domain-containing protein [Sedimentisphaerales bacterium]
MQTTVVGPGNVSFRYKMSSVSGDSLAFYIDTNLAASWSQGSTWPWTGNFAVPSGTHTLKWKYYKYSGSTAGSCWIDAIQWSGGVPGSGGGADWEQITYTYDPSGRRIAKDVDGVVTKYLYDGDQCIAEYACPEPAEWDANDVLLRKYIHGPCIDEPRSASLRAGSFCMIEAAGGYAGTYFYHYDALGSVVALSDADGDTVQVYEYDVYGQVAASDPNHPNRFMFTGHEFDTETGLYYYRARYYNPTIGRFLQTDPIGYEGGMNMFGYCGNNSLNCVDPLGLDWTFGTGVNDLQGYYWDGERNLLLQLTGTYNFQGVASEMESNPAYIHTIYIYDPCDPCDPNKVIGVLFYYEGPREFWEIPDDWDPVAGGRGFVDVAEVELASQHGGGRHRHTWLEGIKTEDLQGMYEEARRTGDNVKANQIKEEQKARQARQSRVKKIIYTTGGALGEALREAWEDPSLANVALAGGIVIGGTTLVIGALVGGMLGWGS